jgi:predicted DCC family thiol-disulfide oxidoreductase YuxK
MKNPGKPVLIYNGACNLCTRLTYLVIRADKKGKIALAPFQSRSAEQWLSERGLTNGKGNTVIYFNDDRVYLRSTAILRLFSDLGGLWKITGIFYILPERLRDALYNVLSRNRYRLFGRKNNCIISGTDPSGRVIE